MKKRLKGTVPQAHRKYAHGQSNLAAAQRASKSPRPATCKNTPAIKGKNPGASPKPMKHNPAPSPKPGRGQAIQTAIRGGSLAPSRKPC